MSGCARKFPNQAGTGAASAAIQLVAVDWNKTTHLSPSAKRLVCANLF